MATSSSSSVSNATTTSASHTRHHRYIDWKQMEEKPKNWESISALLQQCYHLFEEQMEGGGGGAQDRRSDASAEGTTAGGTEEGSGNRMNTENAAVTYFTDYLEKKYTKHSVFVSIFRPLYMSLLKNIRGGGTGPPGNPSSRSGGHKKHKPSKRQDILDKNQQVLWNKEWSNFQMDKSSGYPLRSMRGSAFYLGLCEWVIWWMIGEANGKPYLVRIQTDSILSLGRVASTFADAGATGWIGQWARMVYEKARAVWSSTVHLPFLFSHPLLMIEPYSVKHTEGTRLYEEQIRVLHHVMNSVVQDRPLLLGDRMPPGTGKTFLSIPLTLCMKRLRRKKTLLYVCSNELVRMDVCTLALLGNDLHLWVGRQCMGEDGTPFSLLRPHKRCFPNVWKQVYKKEDVDKLGDVHGQLLYYEKHTQRQADIIVCDLMVAFQLLTIPTERSRWILYLDEVVSDPISNQWMARILNKGLCRWTILVSAILFRFEDVPSLGKRFMQQFDCDSTHIVRIEANQLVISCSVVNKKGTIVFPHHSLKSIDELAILVQKCREDPLLGRMYSPKHVFALFEWMEKKHPDHPFLVQHSFGFFFQDPCDIHHVGVREFVLMFFLELCASDQKDLFDTLMAFHPRIDSWNDHDGANPLCIEKILSDQCLCYQGKTLVITEESDLFRCLERSSAPLLDGCPKVEHLDKSRRAFQKQQEIEMNRLSQSKMAKLEKAQVASSMNALQCPGWPVAYVLHHPACVQRFGLDRRCLTICPRLPYLLEEVYHDSFDPFLLSLLYTGVGVYHPSQMTEHQRRLVMSMHSKLAFLWAGQSVVFGTNIAGLTHLFIHHTFGKKANRNVLFQLIGRIGRIGMSYEAQVVIDDDDVLHTVMNVTDVVDSDALFFEEALLGEETTASC